jgi:hypothetical protein
MCFLMQKKIIGLINHQGLHILRHDAHDQSSDV